ncbi:hypothetical protein [Roseibium sediminis]|uniref:hypothetical protein n=1 Tax=Roseibium sediminis TaxID=1775174 RepID=UPI001AD8FF97|nr:hypothetical protein [Roseibium sediminis]
MKEGSTKSTNSTVAFSHPFSLKGHSEILPAGNYEVIVEEELLQGLSFLSYRKTATYLIVNEKGKTTMWEIFGNDLESMLTRDSAMSERIEKPKSEHGTQED